MPWLTRHERDKLEQEAVRQFLAERRVTEAGTPAWVGPILDLTKFDRLFLWMLRIDPDQKEPV